MSALRVRAYNVRFGDALLVSVPDTDPQSGVETTRHILIDVGNSLATQGGINAVFKPVVEDIVAVLAGAPLDLYVMTHEHLDHVEGLAHANKAWYGGGLKALLKTRFSWLTGSAEPTYYDADKHPEARTKKKLAEDVLSRARASVGDLPIELRDLLRIHGPLAALGLSTNDCVGYLRALAEKTVYVHRELDLQGAHPFKEARLKILAPEEDTADYYQPLRPMVEIERPAAGQAAVGPPRANPPAGVDAESFYNLIELRGLARHENLLSIDKAANNTSVVFTLEWRGWKLLFSGDAELRSWATMARNNDLSPVHFLKVSHHGSHNGTPPDEILAAILPLVGTDNRGRVALASTYPGTYGGIPHGPTDSRLAARAVLAKTLREPREPEALAVDIEFSEEGGTPTIRYIET